MTLALKASAKAWKANLDDYQRGQMAQRINCWRAENTGRLKGWRMARDAGLLGSHVTGSPLQPFTTPKIDELIENYIKKYWLSLWQRWQPDFKQICPIKACDINKWADMNSACRQCNRRQGQDT